jgi:hypothetical protein
MRHTSCHTRAHGTVTVDVHNQAPSLQLLGDGKALIACVAAFLPLDLPCTHQASCRGGGYQTR